MKPKYISLLALALALAAAGAHASRPVDETRSVSPDVMIEIENLSGEIAVTGWDRAEVSVTGYIGDDTEGLSIEGGDDHLSIEVEIPERTHRRRNDFESRLEIRVPTGARLQVEGVSSSIEVEGVTGRIELESVSGSIDVTGARGTTEAETVSGSIRIEGSETPVSAESVSGSVRIRGASGRVEATSVSGTVDVEASSLERGELETISGSVRFQGDLAEGARLDIECHSGNVSMELPADISATFDVTTFSGSIDNELGPAAKRTDKYLPSKKLEFTAGSGSARVSVESFSGNVTLRKQR